MNIFWRKRSAKSDERNSDQETTDVVQVAKKQAVMSINQANKDISKLRGLIEENHITIKIQSAITGR